MTTVYLGGQITGLTYDEATGWRRNVAALLARYGIKTLDPMRGKEHLAQADVPLTAWFDNGLGAVKRDLADIDVSDVMLMNLQDVQTVSIGCMAEMGYAFSSQAYWESPEIVAVVNTPTYDHIFVAHMCHAIYTTLEQALDHIIDRYAPDVAPGSGGVHGVELQDGTEGYRGWLSRSDQAPAAVADQPLRRAEVDGGREADASPSLTAIRHWIDALRA